MFVVRRESDFELKKLGHYIHPWDDAVIVPIEELAECYDGLNKLYHDKDGGSFIMSREIVLENWKYGKEKLDPYILPQPSGFHDIGIRYGDEPSEYLSPAANKEKTAALLLKYRGI